MTLCSQRKSFPATLNHWDVCHRAGFFFPEKAMEPHSSTLSWNIPWMEEPAWWAAVHGVAKSRTWLKQLSSNSRVSPAFDTIYLKTEQSLLRIDLGSSVPLGWIWLKGVKVEVGVRWGHDMKVWPSLWAESTSLGGWLLVYFFPNNLSVSASPIIPWPSIRPAT